MKENVPSHTQVSCDSCGSLISNHTQNMGFYRINLLDFADGKNHTQRAMDSMITVEICKDCMGKIEMSAMLSQRLGLLPELAQEAPSAGD